MAELGNVLEPEESGPRGDDMHYRVEVPRAALGHPDGVRVHVPARIEHAGERVPRALCDDDGEHPLLRLGPDFPEGGAVKLRGQGAHHSSGAAGDLILRVRLTDEALDVSGADGAGAGAARYWIALVLAAAAGAAYWLLGLA